MSKHLVTLAAIGALMACSAAARPAASAALEAQAASPVLSCEVRLTPTRHGLRIEALAHGAAAAAGEYDLVISKSGPNGASDISQGGAFEVGSDAHVTLSSAEFNIERGDHYRASLALRDETGVLCRDERRS